MNSLNINGYDNQIADTSHLKNPVDIAIKKFEQHPSILTIKNKGIPISSFSFTEVTLDNIQKEITNLDDKKSGTYENIPAKILKKVSDVCIPVLLKIWNGEIINENIFPHELKLADVTPIFKKEDTTLAKNYRPVSVLPTVSKIFEKLIQKQLVAYIDQYLSPFLCGYRKGYSPQTALVSLIEKWKISLDQKEFAGALLMDLSKAFDTINHELLIAKLYAYGLSTEALKILHSYLTDRKQRIKINTTFSLGRN